VLAYPLMPKLGSALWSALGHHGAPSMAQFVEATQPAPPVVIPRFTPLAGSDLASCLPETLMHDPVPARRS
jgi:hypothetical protein